MSDYWYEQGYEQAQRDGVKEFDQGWDAALVKVGNMLYEMKASNHFDNATLEELIRRT